MSSFEQSDVFVDNPATNPVPVTIVGEFGTSVNIYSTASANFNIETNILTYTVSAGQTLNIDSVELWGNYFGEWFVRVNGAQVGGTNLSAAERSKTLNFDEAPIVVNAGDMVTVSVQHQYAGAVQFKTNLMGRLR